MANNVNRIVTEWEANISLHKWHDDLKQKRFSYFITIHTFLLGMAGASVRFFYHENEILFCLMAIVLALLGAFLAVSAIRMDARARAYVTEVKCQLVKLEEEWNAANPNNQLTTYIRQRDRFRLTPESESAHASEQKIMAAFVVIWMLVFLFAIAVLAYDTWGFGAA